MPLELDSLSLIAEVAKLQKEFEGKGAKPSFDREAYLLIKAKRKPIVLAVDDRSDILSTLKIILGTECKFFGVTSGAAALDFLGKHETPDLYILDIEMPGMNGFELARAIEQMGKKTVYIFLTSNSDRDSLFEAVDCGAVDFIVKPCREKVILKKFHNIFGS